MRTSLLAILAGCLPLAAACGDDPGSADPDASVRATWYQDIAPLLAGHCMGCHNDAGIAPFAMTTYEEAREMAPIALFAVESGLMPPFDAEGTDDCSHRLSWRDDPRLSAAQIETFRAWIDDGYALGEVAPIPPPPDTALDGVTHTVVPPVGHATSGVADEFVCFILDPGITSTQWMTGLQVRPGKPEVVHHAVMMAMQPGPALDAAKASVGVGQPFDCPGGVAALDGTYLLGVWTPGNQPTETQPDLGIPMAPGAAVIVQIHYHPGGQSHAPDATAIDLRMSSTRPANVYTIVAVGNAAAAPLLLPGPADPVTGPAFFIPAGAVAHTEAMRFEVQGDGTGGPQARFGVFMAYPHMHYVGLTLEVDIERAAPRPGEPADECLIGVPRWSFDWQRSYQYDVPLDQLPTIGAGDVINVRCSYDNSLDNPYVQRALTEIGLSDPIDVVLGEETLDEMCLGIFGIVLPTASARIAPGGGVVPPLTLVPVAATP